MGHLREGLHCSNEDCSIYARLVRVASLDVASYFCGVTPESPVEVTVMFRGKKKKE
jgi:hypothetical protein